MKPYVLSLLPKEDVNLLGRIKRLIELIPDNLDLGKDSEGKQVVLSCHILAHAFGKLYPESVVVKDGNFSLYDHSWLETKNGNVIDVYPLGIWGGSLLIEGKRSPMKYLYVENPAVSRDNINKPHIQKAIELMYGALSHLNQ